MKVLFVNNDGGGFADYVEVEPNLTVDKFFTQQMASRSPTDHLIRVNRQAVAKDRVLQEGDRISITPTKIAGTQPA
jgi:hypothetical protein